MSNLFLISILRTVSTFSFCPLNKCLCQFHRKQNSGLLTTLCHKISNSISIESRNTQCCTCPSNPIFLLWHLACSYNSCWILHVTRKTGWKQRSDLGCEATRGLRGDTVTRWCYSNLFGRQSYAETEGLMTQSTWSEFGSWHYVLPPSICMPLKSWMETAQETSKKIIQGPGTKMAFCPYRKV